MEEQMCAHSIALTTMCEDGSLCYIIHLLEFSLQAWEMFQSHQNKMVGFPRDITGCEGRDSSQVPQKARQTLLHGAQ